MKNNNNFNANGRGKKLLLIDNNKLLHSFDLLNNKSNILMKTAKMVYGNNNKTEIRISHRVE